MKNTLKTELQEEEKFCDSYIYFDYRISFFTCKKYVRKQVPGIQDKNIDLLIYRYVAF